MTATADSSVVSGPAYDPVSATLIVESNAFDELTRLVAGGLGPADWDNRWNSSGIVVDGSLMPMVETMVRTRAEAVRHISLERVAGGVADEMMVAWDSDGHVVMQHRLAHGRLAVQVSSFEVLPVLMSQHLRLFRSGHMGDVERKPMAAATAQIDALLGVAGTETSPEFQNGIGAVQLVWAATAGWTSSDPDAKLMGLNCSMGHWLVGVQSDPSSDDDTKSASQVQLEPVGVTEALERLGSLVGGR